MRLFIILFLIFQSTISYAEKKAKTTQKSVACAPNLSYVSNQLVIPALKNDSSLSQPFTDLLKSSGGAGMVIASETAQKAEYQKTLDSAIASLRDITSAGTDPMSVINEGIPSASCTTAVCAAVTAYYLSKDGMAMSDAAIETAKCYLKQGY